ncbi:MAG: RnfABCDGE type electron transport complex subunit D, partial [Bacillota bacterium]
VSSVIFEKPFVKNSSLLGDGSAFLAGTLLGLTLPPTVPWWIPIVGGFITVIIGKHLFGGLGSNIFNPALIARAVLLLSYPSLMIKWISPVDGVSAATPLALGHDAFSYSQLIIGNIPGSIGETSVIALAAGGIYLYFRDYIDLKIPLSFITGAALTSLLLGQDPIFAVLSGGIIFGAVYMATDMVTSPVSKWAKIAYGLLGGFLTIFIRHYTPYPEGITFAILIINGVSYLFDSILEGPHFGEVEYIKEKAVQFASIIIVSMLILLVGITLIGDNDIYPGTLTYNHLKEAAPEADSFEIVEKENEDILFSALKEGEGSANLVYIARNGFEAPIEILLTLNENGEIENTEIIEESESPTLGARIKDPEFLLQFNNFSIEDVGQVMDKTDTISGATFSSQAAARAVNAGLELMLADQEAGLTDGSYRGSARGAKGEIVVEVNIADGDIEDVRIIEDQETEYLAEPAYKKLKAELLEKQDTSLTIVSGATYTSEAFIEAVELALQKAEESAGEGSFSDGEHTGSAEGHVDQIEVKVIVESGEISVIEVLSQNETKGLGDKAIETVKAKIIETQELDVDLVSGATNSSNGLINAVKNALNIQDSTETNEQSYSSTDTDSGATAEGGSDG